MAAKRMKRGGAAKRSTRSKSKGRGLSAEHKKAISEGLRAYHKNGKSTRKERVKGGMRGMLPANTKLSEKNKRSLYDEHMDDFNTTQAKLKSGKLSLKEGLGYALRATGRSLKSKLTRKRYR